MVRLTPLRLLCTAAVVCLFVLTTFVPSLFAGERGYDVVDEPPAAASKMALGEEPCPRVGSGALGDMTVVLKIGAAEAKSRLPQYLNRLGRCKLDLIVFSDRRDSHAGFDLTDALAHLRPEYKYANADFDVYDRIQAANATDDKSPDGWRLDKYKFLPMMEWTSYLRPASQWYVFIELDTYVNYDNLHRFLARFDPRRPYYFGSPVWPAKRKKKTVFAHGGTGYVLSRAALDRLMARGRMFAENQHFPGTHLFGEDLSKQCCGDEVLAQVLRKSGVPLRGYWPMFNGEKPLTVRFGREHWCEAVITMHHLSEDDFTGLSQWEKARSHPSRPLMFEELFTMIQPHLQERADDWSNLSDDKVFKQANIASTSVDQCYSACLRDTSCLQYEHSGKECRLGYTIRLGQHQSPDGDQKWTSGWMRDRIKAFVSANSPCQGAHFVHPNP